MDQRFVTRQSAPAYVGEGGRDRTDNTDGVRSAQPTSAAGTIAPFATFEDLATGERWYYDGAGWKPVKDLVLAELRAMREEQKAQHGEVVEVLTAIRDALLRIAPGA